MAYSKLIETAAVLVGRYLVRAQSHLCSASYRERYACVSTPNRRQGVAPDDHNHPSPAFQKELFAIYKSIGRNLVRKELRDHNGCIGAIGRHAYGVVRNHFLRGSICVSANAFLLWRMKCEGVNDPRAFFQSRRKPKLDFLFESLDREGTMLSRWSNRRIFALTLLGLFNECLLICTSLNRKGLYSFCPALIQGTRTPHWIVERSDNGIQTVHWWIRQPPTTHILQDRSCCPRGKRIRYLWMREFHYIHR